ncbi:MAG: vWA domain-containing protein [Planctomycetota bacterium]
MVVLLCILLPILLIVAAFVVNLAHVESTTLEIQITTDAAARAAGRVYTNTGSHADAVVAAQEAASQNSVGSGVVVPIVASDVAIGRSSRSSSDSIYDFTPSSTGNAVRVTTQALYDGNGNAVPTLLPFLSFTDGIRPLRTAVSTQIDIDVALVVDRSGSMAYAANETAQYPPAPAAAPPGWSFGDAVPRESRWLDLVASVGVFISVLDESPQQELLALAVYNDDDDILVDLTEDYSEVIPELEDISREFESGATNIGGGLMDGLKAVTDTSRSREDAAKVIVLMTDGVHNTGSSPHWAAGKIAEKGVYVFTITFSDEANQSAMQSVAEECGGRHFHAVNGVQLQQAFQEIAKYLPSLITQ